MRLAAVRRLAYEASDTGLLSPDLAAGIRRVKGAKRLGARIGNWLTVDQSRSLLGDPLSGTLRGKRDRAILALLIGCGLRRAELVGLETEDFQIREERCVIADLVGKGSTFGPFLFHSGRNAPSMFGTWRLASMAGRSFVE